jgi:four helix bundle protein
VGYGARLGTFRKGYRSADSIGANIAESSGRFHPGDVIRFMYYARGSLKETRYWLRRAARRKLITHEQLNSWMDNLTQLAKDINSYIGFQRQRTVKEPNAPYTISQEEPGKTNQPTNKPTNEPTNQR